MKKQIMKHALMSIKLRTILKSGNECTKIFLDNQLYHCKIGNKRFRDFFCFQHKEQNGKGHVLLIFIAVCHLISSSYWHAMQYEGWLTNQL
jgi:hypothetical protein